MTGEARQDERIGKWTRRKRDAKINSCCSQTANGREKVRAAQSSQPAEKSIQKRFIYIVAPYTRLFSFSAPDKKQFVLLFCLNICVRKQNHL